MIFFASLSTENAKDYDSSVLASDIELVEVRSNSYDSDTGYESEHITYSPKYYFKYKGESYTCNSNTSSSSVDTSKRLVYFYSNVIITSYFYYNLYSRIFKDEEKNGLL